ncbi:BREX system serine/threonine kinase PglW [Actinomadura craniellae]|uniref:BREX system serine/threonine kinase PglW n=1 Tax=Actinomadura craniellae TaxID=2231787 RepID=UPI00131403ED|nr:BREX system serine/threonine kinase PglW [Actinomadura craniellae]
MSNRWWGPRSDFPWEEDALRHVRDQMPRTDPYRAWQTFTFTARTGHVREVDLFAATRAGLFLVEIKSHPGRAINSGGTWIFHGHDRTRSFDNPLHLADLKCKQLREQLEWAAKELGLTRLRIPYIAPAVFLSAPDLRCEFDDVQKINVYGRDGAGTGLPGIWRGLLGGPPRGDLVPVSKQLHKLLTKIGVAGLRRHRRVGPFELAPKAFDAGPTWEDYLAENTALPGDQPRRIRVYLSELGATRDDRLSTRRAARREYLALQGISHEGIVQAEQFSDEHEAGPSIVFRHGAAWTRLDHFMAERGAELPVETRAEMVRQLGEALDHAHRRHLYHRALAARSVHVELDGRYPRLRICDWQVAARPDTSATSDTSLDAHIENSAGPYLAPEFGSREAEGAQLDVFGLGALTHLILTARPPAPDRRELAQRLGAEGALVPSAVDDAMSPAMDELVRRATALQPADRYESVRSFLDQLEAVEDELTAPDRADEPDLLEATRGATVAGWRIEKVLGKGSTAKALLVTRDGHERVLKVALSAAGRTRLEHEAAQLGRLGSPYIVRLVGGPHEIGDRTYLVLEQAGRQTLAQALKSQGRLTIDELQTLGGHLFQAVQYLEDEGVWHRDIKPDNLALKELPKKGRRLVLFDFSLADAADRNTHVGTPPYLDPFLGGDRRPVYDAAAERYAVAMTLHEMAGAELPAWGDGVVEPRLLPEGEQVPQLAEDSFDPLLRDRLVAFFRTALHRDPARRHASLTEMTLAWSDVFRDLDETLPATTAGTVGERAGTPEDARETAAALATEATPLVAAGLSARALSAALQQLGVSTVGELARIPATRVQRLRGVGLGPRNELQRRAREWRQQLAVAERSPESDVAVVTDLRRLGLDEVADRLPPKDADGIGSRVVRLLLALPDAEGRPSPVPPWAPHAEVAAYLEMDPSQVARLLGAARARWTKSARAVTALRATVLELLNAHGRVMEAGQLAAALLAARGCALDDPAARQAVAAACVRAAVETEEHLENPRLAKRRAHDRVLVAAVAEDDPSAPVEEELLDYAVELGARADRLVALPDAAAPLPSPAAVNRELSAVPRPEGMPPLSDTDLVSLAAGASRNAAATARLELYPRDLDPAKALTLAQAAGFLGGRGIEPGRLRERVLARFPELANLPEGSGDLRRLLQRELGVTVLVDGVGEDSRFVLRGRTLTGMSGGRPPLPGTGTRLGADTPADETWQRLRHAVERGGFLAVKAWADEAAAVRDALCTVPGVTVLHVADTFVAELRAIVTERGRPRWETVLAADSPDASPAARTGLARLVAEAFARIEERVRALDGTVLLHDPAPLGRYPGGLELLTRLRLAAGDPAERPDGLWLLCPMPDPRHDAAFDGHAVGAQGESEQVAVPSGFTSDLIRSM